MTAAPKHIRVFSEESLLEIQWGSEFVHRIPLKILRGLCPCASCVNELSGERMIDINAISEDIKPTHLEHVGNYAVKISWTDQHNTGLYTWEHLHNICEAVASASEKTH